MGCNNSTEELDTSVVPGVGPIHNGFAKGGTTVDSSVAILPDDKPVMLPNPQVPETNQIAKPEPAPIESGTFPVPKGWRVVCRLSPSDVHSRWGTRPRPPGPNNANRSGAGTAFEADLVLPEFNQPLRLPLQLLPQWTDPQIGIDFMGRYAVKKRLPDRPGIKGQFFEVFDQSGQTACALHVCNLSKEPDVKVFVERLQLESLDSENRLFLRLRDIALALPGRLAVIEDIPCKNLWDEFSSKIEPESKMVAKVAAIANSVLGGLCRLHAYGWAHCGVSPDTVCLAVDGHWKLMNLEHSRKVGDLLAQPVAKSTGTAVPPEVLLNLRVSEKVDVWQLAATLCEAIMQKRINGAGGNKGAVAQQMCTLVDFLGPLPDDLVSRHPNREELFTPEGQVLRCATPSFSGEKALEVIEPSSPQPAPSSGNDSYPRPRLVSEALAGIEGAGDIMEFLGRLLNPDPEQRPSATEAMAHHFLRFAHTKCVGINSDKKKAKVQGHDEDHKKNEHVLIEDKHGDNESSIVRKGTGFVRLDELPPSDDEEDEEEEEEVSPSGKTDHIRINDKHGDNENKIVRKGTGFVHVGELPPSDDEDEEETEHVKIQDTHGDNENKIVRKGTGFVHMTELPPSDDEDEDEEEEEECAGGEDTNKKVQLSVERGSKSVNINDDHTDNSNKLQRKGTGFVYINELPPSDDEEEDEEEESCENNGKKGVKIQDSNTGGGNEGAPKNNISRKGTGFARAHEIPSIEDDGSDEEENVKSVRIDPETAEESPKKEAAKPMRKGTGFVNVSELPDTDDEEDEDD